MKFIKLKYIHLFIPLIILLYSSSDCTFNVDNDLPASPQNIEHSVEPESVSFKWKSNTEADLEGYNIYRSTSSINSVQNLNPLNEGILQDTIYTDTNIENGVVYYYRVTAVDINSNESEPSREIEVTSFAGPPDRPKK